MLLLLLYPKHVIKPLGYNLGCYSFSPERKKAINEDFGKLLQAGAIKEVEYPEWLANVVLVKKANGKWRLCIDFTDVNKACQKIVSLCRDLTSS